jgi:2-alkenal reductase
MSGVRRLMGMGGTKARAWTLPRFAVGVALFAVVLSAACSPASAPAESKDPGTGDGVRSPAALYDEGTVVALYDRSIPAVVEITATVMMDIDIPEHDDLELDPSQSSQGSGFIIDEQGHILTNFHVVNDATEVRAILHDDRVLAVEIVGTDRESDLALLRVDPHEVAGVTPLPLGDSGASRPGQMAVALGSPYGLSGSVTVGVISGIGRSLQSTSSRLITELLQTDAAVNPGNSGGPLLNSAGEVVGINTAIEIASNGIGYAIPINLAKSLLPALLDGGEVGTPWLGISGQPVDSELAEELDLAADRGVYVVTVFPDSPAEEAGLVGMREDERGGDIITEINGVAVASVLDILGHLNGRAPGDGIVVTVLRGEETLEVDVTLGEWQDMLPQQDDLP